ncbi:MAG TPA: DUF935 family protein, partial [Ignavibacteriales bacterium]|nr:DUF935 family protein [Ignavibacteriales bacterium]
STIQQRKGIVQSLLWEIDKGSASSRELKFIEEMFANLKIDKLINQMLNAPLYGFSVLEVNWKKEGAYFIPAEVREKPNEWFIFDNENNLKLRTMSKPYGEDLPERKFILLQFNDSYDNPYGERVLAKCFWPVTFKRGGLRFWAVMTEKFGMPFIIGKQPRGAGEEAAKKMLENMETMVQDAIAVVPDDSSVEVLEGSKSTSADLYKAFIEINNSEISKAILSQTLTTENQGKGSYGATETHKKMLESLADKKLVEEGFNTLIRWAIDVNFANGKYPVFRLYEEEDVDKDLADRDALLVQQGVKFNKDYYVQNYNLDEKHFEIDGAALSLPADGSLPEDSQAAISTMSLNGAQVQAATRIVAEVSNGTIPRDSGIQQLETFFGFTHDQAVKVMGSAGTGEKIEADKVVNAPKTAKPIKPETPAAEFAEAEVKDYQDILDKMVNNIPPEYLQKQMEKILKPALDYLKKDISFSEMEEGIMKLYPDMNTEELQDRIAKMIFIAEIIGREDAKRG